jgi:hypothetical protein
LGTVRPQRIIPADAAFRQAPGLAAVAIIKQNAAGLNFNPTIGTARTVGQTYQSQILEVEGYTRFVVYASATVGASFTLNVQMIDPNDAVTVLTAIPTGTAMGAPGVITPFPFGVNNAPTNLPFLLISLQWNCTANASISFHSALECSNP